MSLQTVGRASVLSPHRRREAVAGVLENRSVYSRMVEDEAIVGLKGVSSEGRGVQGDSSSGS